MKWARYEEVGFILLQNLIIMSILCSYAKSAFKAISNLIAFSAFGYCLMYYASDQMLLSLQWSNVFIGIARWVSFLISSHSNVSPPSKIPQIVTNSMNRSTGQLSIVTTLLQTAGNWFQDWLILCTHKSLTLNTQL